MDLSPLRKFEVLGPDAEALLQATITRDAQRLAVGQVTYTAVCNETGGMIDDATRVPARAGQLPVRRRRRRTTASGCRNRPSGAGSTPGSSPRPTSCTTSPSGAGEPRDPRARSSGPRPRRRRSTSSRWFRFLVGRVRRAPTGSRSSSRAPATTGELGYEVWCHPDDGPAPSGTRSGRRASRAGLRRSASDALDMRADRGRADRRRLRVRPDQVDPFEAGDRVSRSTCEETRTSSAAPPRERKAHPQRTLVGLELEGNETRRARRPRVRRAPARSAS